MWTDIAPYVDDRVIAGAKKAGLPTSATRLAKLVDADDLPRLCAACVRVSLER